MPHPRNRNCRACRDISESLSRGSVLLIGSWNFIGTIKKAGRPSMGKNHGKTYCLSLLILLFGLVGPLQSFAAFFYIRALASGANTGADWNNAWKNMNEVNFAVINPGDTIYMAAGTYSSLNITKSGAVGNPITFKRATITEHGPSPGWTNVYDGRVIIDGRGSLGAIGIGEGGTYSGQSHITVDGSSKYGIWLRSALHGIRAVRGSSNNLTFRSLEIGDPGAYKLGEDGIQGYGNNLLVEHCYIHDNDSIETHGDGIQWSEGNGFILRYNIIKNSGQIFMLGSHVWDSRVNDAEIYYNIFYNRGGTHYNGMTLDTNTPEPGHYVRIYNNTFDLEARDNSGYNNIFNIQATTGTVEFKNNAVIYSHAGSVGGSAHNNNGYDSSGGYAVYGIPTTEKGAVISADLGFFNIEAADYRLLSSSPLMGKGVNVGLTKDFDGNPVPAIPSIGAFEPKSAVSPAPLPLKAPTNLRLQ